MIGRGGGKQTNPYKAIVIGAMNRDCMGKQSDLIATVILILKHI
jgi:hypothetical protein